MNCKYCQNEKCIMKGIPNEFHRKCPDAIATNADRLNAMTTEEKARFLCKLHRYKEYGQDETADKICEQLWLNWLKQEVNDVNFD